MAILFSCQLLHADDTTPFVVGFERFARHDDIDATTAGQLLVTELSCTACHASNVEALSPKLGPTLGAAGSRVQPKWIEQFVLDPNKAHAASTMPAMLHSIAEKDRPATAQAIAAYLTTLVEPFPEIKATGANPVPLEFHDRGDTERGKRLFHSIGCVACHEPSADYEVAQVQPSDLDRLLDELEPEELEKLGLSSSARKVPSIPLPNLSEKYSRKSLTYFLLNPEGVRPSGRMPNFSLKPVDAADIAAFLTPAQAPKSVNLRPNNNGQLVVRGKALFSELRCNSCHQVQNAPVATATGKPLATLNLGSQSSCVQGNDQNTDSAPAPANALPARKRGQPLYQLDAKQLSSLASVVGTQQPANKNTRPQPPAQPALPPQQTLQLTMLQLNCYACHDRQSKGGMDRYRKPYFETVNNVDIGDEGRLPPTLTGVGKKLVLEWMEKVFKGEATIRSHMTIRMPVYGKKYIKLLPQLLSRVDAEPTKGGDVFAKADKKALQAAGRQLMDAGCVQCHSFRGQALPGVVGVDLSEVDKRIQPKFLHDFLKDPGSLKPRTRMPTFFPDGKSQYADILGGDMELQLAALVAYMSDLKNQPLPAKIEEARSQSFELTPKEQPIVLRTFMPVGGFHAIAVGYPQQIHFAFDSQRCNIAEAWNGKFIDAEATWFDRFAKPVDPLGQQRVLFPGGPVVALLGNKNAPWPTDANSTVRFSGYKLDDQGIPTFLYQIREGQSNLVYYIADRMQPKVDSSGKAKGLSRTLSVRLVTLEAGKGEQATAQSKPTEQIYLRLLLGKQLKRSEGDASKGSLIVSNEDGLIVNLSKSDSTGELRKSGAQSEWIIPVKPSSEQASTLELLYQWKGMP